MNLFENGIGRPSNELKKKRRNVCIGITMLILVAIVIAFLLSVNTFKNKQDLNSESKNAKINASKIYLTINNGNVNGKNQLSYRGNIRNNSGTTVYTKFTIYKDGKNIHTSKCYSHKNNKKNTYVTDNTIVPVGVNAKYDAKYAVYSDSKCKTQIKKIVSKKVDKKLNSKSSVFAAMAEGEVGNNGTKYKNFYGIDGDWCAMFVYWVAAHSPVGVSTTSDCSKGNNSGKCVYRARLEVKSAVVYSYAEWLATKGRFYHSKYYVKKYKTYKDGKSTYTPKRGDLIFFVRENEYSGNPKKCRGEPYHMGIVTGVKNGKVYTVEGNTGNNSHYYSKVGKYSYSLDDKKIMGYSKW